MQPLHLTAMFGSYPKTAPLKRGTIPSSSLALDIAPVDVAQQAFKQVVREHRYDVAELAIVTFLLAYDAGHRFCLLPFVMNGNFHHKSLYCRATDTLRPGDLVGRKVAMRSFSQTTPTWVRGILAEDYGLDLRQIQWWSQQGAHVAEYRDPPWVQPLDPQLGLEEALLAGEVDAIIAGGGLQNPAALRHVIDDPAEAARRWHERTGIIPINHVVVVKPDVARQHPQAVRELYRLLQASRSVGEPPRQTGALDLQPAGFDAIHTSLLRIIHDTHAQGMISRRFSPEELYGEILDQLPDDKELTP